ncbi:hypothetical protein [Actinokineospora globicatena]|uniref:Uncharacterized protein n=1 Tax=Actinokineospora globicatena TaxID=103729 RepID=A0A9W6QQF8_9PSEU|nr:hypothetical protein [Actinokineospora globicatena]MCP2300582.1 hypothetical protein [Actinokineospora globicatena]GLW81127.1 hypothetical protein Aglo01_56080 [Actinokineospora globicatena]GLW88320.1 hypothetical protein Aglo02_59590 [Actinokineospora globicatena]GLW92789.1 hypothetical protein Aglo03_36050 [Actinokineospora globicatena]
MRALISWLLCLAGVAVVGFGAFRPWYEGRAGNTLPLSDLFSGVSRESAPVLGSLTLPLAIGVLLAVVGMFRAKGILQLGGVILAATMIGWVVQAREVVDLGDLQLGAWNALFGSLLVLASGIMRPGRV